MAKILILANNDVGLYKFRKELIVELLKKNKVVISLPDGGFVPQLTDLGCHFIDTQINRRGTNPFSDIKIILKYRKIIINNKPDVVLTYTIKPNIYGGIACRLSGTPFIANITGLGTSIKNKGIVRMISLFLYKVGLKKAKSVFFQNKKNKEFFVNNRIVSIDKTREIAGSGVNLDYQSFEEYPIENGIIKFLFIARIMRAKGVDELFEAAQIIKKSYPNTEFHFIGIKEENYDNKLIELVEKGIIHYHGSQDNVHSFIKDTHATINPSYHEGMSNVLLESAASGRPILASKIPGCLETFNEGVSGLGFKAKSVDSLVETIIKFIDLTYEEKKKMGLEGRKKMEMEFDRNNIVRAYVKEIDRVVEEKQQ